MWTPIVATFVGITSLASARASRGDNMTEPMSVESLFEPGKCGVGSNPHNHFANSGIKMMSTKLRDWRALNVELKRSALWMERNVKSRAYSNIGGYMSPLFGVNFTEIANSSAVKVIQDHVVRAVQNLVDKEQCNTMLSPRYEAIVQNAWFNVIRNGNYNLMHVHQGGRLDKQRMVAVYYVEADDSESSPMVIGSPWHRWKPNDDHKLCTTGENKYCTSDGLIVEASAVSGTLLLLPGTLFHAVPPSKSKNVRISIAFNVELKAHDSKSSSDSPPCFDSLATQPVFQTCEMFSLRELGPNFLGTNGHSLVAPHVSGTAVPLELFGSDGSVRSLHPEFSSGSGITNSSLSGIAITSSGKSPHSSCSLPGLKNVWHFEHYKHHYSRLAPILQAFGAAREPVLLPKSIVLLPGLLDLQNSGQLRSLRDAANASSCSVLLFAIHVHADSAVLAPSFLLQASYDDALYFLRQMKSSNNDADLIDFLTTFEHVA